MVVLLAVTAFGHVLEVLRRTAEDGPVEVFFLDLIPERGYVAVVITPKDRTLCYASPSTRLGRNAVFQETEKSEKNNVEGHQ
jgi:hypothetical protein